MIKKIEIFQSKYLDPYYNLAIEQYLLESLLDEHCILYLWQNQKTVVIGRNQNAWKECRVSLLENDGGYLARRLSGGGAVFHDLGNLNFTFLLPVRDFNISRQLSVITKACQMLGLQAEVSGRNDVLAEGKKFSGNAFYKNGERAYHHGTLMLDVDREKLNRYLNPSKAKLEARGINSVKSRVINLQELIPGLKVQELENVLIEAFSEVYKEEVHRLSDIVLNQKKMDVLRSRFAAPEWIYGFKEPLSFFCEKRFLWGDIQIELEVKQGVIKRARVYTDALDWTLAARLEQAIIESPFKMHILQKQIREKISGDRRMEDICQLLEEQEI